MGKPDEIGNAGRELYVQLANGARSSVSVILHVWRSRLRCRLVDDQPQRVFEFVVAVGMVVQGLAKACQRQRVILQEGIEVEALELF